MKDIDSIKDQLKKIAALAERGEGGEQISAKIMLDKLLLKYNLTIDNLRDNAKTECYISYKNKWERSLITQIYCKITNKSTISYNQSKSQRMTWKVDLTKLEAAEFYMMYNIYTKAYAKELKNLQHAFISKHELYSTNSEGKECTLTKEDIEKIMRMRNSMNDVLIPRGQIEEGR